MRMIRSKVQRIPIDKESQRNTLLPVESPMPDSSEAVAKIRQINMGSIIAPTTAEISINRGIFDRFIIVFPVSLILQPEDRNVKDSGYGLKTGG
jgi:hypothetical protein